MTVDPNAAPLNGEKLDEIEALVKRLLEERASYFDRTRGHFDREDAARSYRATAKEILSEIAMARSRAQDDTSREGDWQIEAFDRTLRLARDRNMDGLGGSLDLAHLDDMRARLTASMSRGKVGRWLGWAQAAVVASGCATLDDMKEINRRCSEESAVISRPLEAAPVDGGEAVSIEAVMVPKPALDWLMGADTDPAGLWFGEFPDDHPRPPGNFWWRKTFREICVYYAPRMLKSVLSHPTSVSPARTDAKRIAELEARLSEPDDRFDDLLQKFEALRDHCAALTDKSGNAELIEAAPGTHPVERLWRACGLPEYFLGNGGTNTKLYALYDAIAALSRSPAPDRMGWQQIETAPTNRAILLHFKGLDYYGNNGVYAGMLVDMGTGKRWMTFGWACGRDVGDAPDAWCPMPSVASFNKEEGE